VSSETGSAELIATIRRTTTSSSDINSTESWRHGQVEARSDQELHPERVTDKGAVDSVRDFLRNLGKKPVCARSIATNLSRPGATAR
jgi:DNA/RNA-binding domain of Phe-tRNA-synthetase-like protein